MRTARTKIDANPQAEAVVFSAVSDTVVSIPFILHWLEQLRPKDPDSMGEIIGRSGNQIDISCLNYAVFKSFGYIIKHNYYTISRAFKNQMNIEVDRSYVGSTITSLNELYATNNIHAKTILIAIP